MGTASDEDVEFLKNEIAKKKNEALSQDELISKINKKKQKSGSYLDTATDFVRGFEKGATYGYAPDILSNFPGEGSEEEISKKFEQSEKRSPTAFEIGDIAGFAVSPATKLISAAGRSVPYVGEKLSALLKSADAIKKSKYLSALSRAVGGISEYVVPGSAMVSAQKGEESPSEIAAGGIVNAAVSKYPYVAGGALIGSKIADIATGDTKWNNAASIAGPIAGAIALKGGKTAIDFKNASIDPAVLKAPLEILEKAYLEKGRNTPKEMRGVNRQYKINDLENQSDLVKALRSKADELRIMLMKDVPQDTKTAYKNITSDVGELKYDTISEVLEDPIKSQKIISSIDKMNKDLGINEDASSTFNKMVSSASEQLSGLKDDPMNLTIDDIIVAKVRQTPVRHLRAFNNVFSETRKMRDFNPESVPVDIDKLYAQSLQAERDVDTGRLNKWLRENQDEQNQINYSRLFDPYKPWRLLTDKEAKSLSEQGRQVVFGDKYKEQKIETGTKNKDLDVEKNKQNRVKSNKELMDEFVLTEQISPEMQEYKNALSDLYNMREGQRQMSIERQKPSILPYAITDLLDRASPLKFSEIKKLSDNLPSNKIEKYDKSRRYYANMYGKGKSIENMPEEMRPQILRIGELAKRNDSVGDVFKIIDNQIQNGNIEDAVRAIYFVDSDQNLKKYLK